ncbi:hypothetical protein HK103_006069, partial [Boothiomyces macroporosus]
MLFVTLLLQYVFSQTVSTNGFCGPTYNTICPDSKCCAAFGLCGTGDQYCGAGCQSGFGNCAGSTPTVTTTVASKPSGVPLSPDGSCGGVNGYTCSTGNCCSASGYCGNTEAFCNVANGCQQKFTLGQCSTTPVVKISPDGSCGGVNGYTCSTGNCCSASGYCGNTEAFCNVANGCQQKFTLGQCSTTPVVKISPDGSCGGANGYT